MIVTLFLRANRFSTLDFSAPVEKRDVTEALAWLLALGALMPAPDRSCEALIQIRHSARLPGGRTAPFYADAALGVYLSSRLPELTVLPLHTEQRVAFERDGIVFITTGLLLAAADEEDLRTSLQRAARTPVRVCAWRTAPQITDLPAVRARLQHAIQQHNAWLEPRLKKR